MQYLNSDYEIFEDGTCYSHKSNKWLTPKMTVKYPSYNLTLPDGKRQVKVHRMVAETFLPNPENKQYVNHKDGNTKNFKLENLEWVSAKENAKHASEMGLRPIGNRIPIYYEGDLVGEEWIQVKDFPTYSISSCGRVMNKQTRRLLKPVISTSNGYYEVNLYKERKGHTKQIHTLEYLSFHPDEDLNGYVIHHRDGNKLNNVLNNLEKTTYQNNNLHAVYTHKTNGCAKAVYQIKDGQIIAEYPSAAEAHRVTKICDISVAARKGVMRGGYHWVYKDNFEGSTTIQLEQGSSELEKGNKNDIV